MLQSATVALAEGAGSPTAAAAVADAQKTGWLPDGEAEVPTGSTRGLVRVGPEVVAEFVVEEVGGGLFFVTSVDTCDAA